MAINNLAEQCYLPAYGPLENMNVLTMMDMVKVTNLQNSWLFRQYHLYFFNPEYDFRNTFWTRRTQREEQGD